MVDFQASTANWWGGTFRASSQHRLTLRRLLPLYVPGAGSPCLGGRQLENRFASCRAMPRSVFTSTEHLGSCAPPCLTLELQNPVTREPMEISVPNDRMWSHRLDSIQRDSPKAVKEFDEVTLWRMFSQMLPSTESGSRTKQRCECFVLRKTQCTCLSTFSRVKPFLEKKKEARG